MATMADLARYLSDNHIQYEVLSHAPAYSAHAVAAATHVPEREMAKTLVIRADDHYWMAVIRGDHRISERLLKKALDVKHVRLAHEEDLEKLFPDCEVGAMPPFGNLYALPVVVDQALAEDDEIVFNACTHTESIRMKFADFGRLVKPLVAELVETQSEHGD